MLKTVIYTVVVIKLMFTGACRGALGPRIFDHWSNEPAAAQVLQVHCTLDPQAVHHCQGGTSTYCTGMKLIQSDAYL